MDLHIWMLIVLAMRVVRIVYSGLRVGYMLMELLVSNE